MVTVANVTYLIGNTFVNLLFGDVLLTGIFGSLALLVLLYRTGVQLDASIVIMVSWFFVAGSAMLLPQAFTILVWMVVGILAFLIFYEIFRR